MNKNKSFSITRYTFQSFRHYGGKSIIFMIALAVTLVLALLNILTSLQGSLYNQAISILGDAHFIYNDVTPEQIELLKEQPQIEWTSEVIITRLQANKITSVGEVQDNDTRGIDFLYIEKLHELNGFKITDGETPQKENEAVIPMILAEYLGIEARVGAEFEVNLVSFTLDESGQTIIETPMKFIVSGILQNNSYLETGVELGNSHIMFVSRELVLANVKFRDRANDTGSASMLHEQYGELGVMVRLKAGYEARTLAHEIAEIIGAEKDKIRFNDLYLFASGNDDGALGIFYVTIIFFALVGSIIIYNAFNIVIVKRTRHFGLLTLIGASKKQIQKCVYIEAIFNTAVALPIGLLLGTFLSWIAFPIARAGYDRTGAIFSISAWSYLLTVLITAVMVFAGAIIPARQAGKITPVEAAKFASNTPKGNKKSKKFKTIENVTLSALARANLFRKKGGAGGTIASLSIIGVLFIALSFILFSAFYSVDNLARQGRAADITVRPGRIVREGGMNTRYIHSDNLDVLPEHIIEQIINIDGVEESYIIYHQAYTLFDTEIILNAFGQPYRGSVYGVDDRIFEYYLEKAEMHKETDDNLTVFENPANTVVLRKRNALDNETFENIFISGQALSINTASESVEPVVLNVNMLAITNNNDATPYIFVGDYELPSLVMPLSSFKANNFDLECYAIHLNINESKNESFIANLERIIESEGNIHYSSILESKKMYESQMISMLVLVFAGLGIAFVVSLLNLISTTFISIEQRKKELGILSAIGLGAKELRKMLKWEGIWVSLFSSLISILGGLAAGWLFYTGIDNILRGMGGDNYMELYFPVIPIIIFCLIYIFTPYIIISIAVRRLMRNTMVELMGQEI